MHCEYRRVRAAVLHIIITETVSGQYVAKALSSLIEKLTYNTNRVPAPNGSLAILNLKINHKTSLNGVNTMIKKYTIEGYLVEQIKYSIEKN